MAHGWAERLSLSLGMVSQDRDHRKVYGGILATGRRKLAIKSVRRRRDLRLFPAALRAPVAPWSHPRDAQEEEVRRTLVKATHWPRPEAD